MTPNPAACKICGRELKDWREAERDDPAMDCGGDRLACMIEFEGGIPMSRASPGLMVMTTCRVLLSEEQARMFSEAPPACRAKPS